jgi:hypothetical protein
MDNFKLGFRGTAQQRVDLNPLYFYLLGHLKPLAYSAPTENEETLHQRIFDAVRPFTPAPERLKVCESP